MGKKWVTCEASVRQTLIEPYDMGSRPAKMPNVEDVGNSNRSGNEFAACRFGVFELDLRAGELRRGGLKIKLQEQPLQVLVQLLQRPGEIVTREDLRKHLWPADTFVDFDHSLNAAIRRLRDALGDSAENPTFVETVARRGYRFLAPVSRSANGHAGHKVPALAVVPARAGTPFRSWWIAAPVGAAVLFVLGLALGSHFAPQSRRSS